MVATLGAAACGGDDGGAGAGTAATDSTVATEATAEATTGASPTDPASTEAPGTDPASTEAPTDTVAPPTDAPDGGATTGSPASTVDDLLALGRPVILTHAAGEDTYPHSTPYGFAESVRDGVDVLDIDLRLTADDVVVVHHDADTGRTANEDLIVYETTYDELHALDNAYWFTADCTCVDQPDDAYVLRGVRTGDTEPPTGYTPDDFAITALADIIEEYPDWVLNMEIKASGAEGIDTANVLAELLEEMDALDRSIVTSFDDDVVRHFHDLQPSVTMTPGLDMSTDFVLGGVAPPDWAPIMQIPPVYEGLEVFTPAYVEAARAAGLVTWVWPNGEGEDVEGYLALLQMGADGVNASDPAAGVEALAIHLGERPD